MMTVESAGDPRARSPKGAMGLMQIMPETWADLRAHRRFGNDPYDPHDGILAGAVYLRELHDRLRRDTPRQRSPVDPGDRNHVGKRDAARSVPACGRARFVA